MHHVYHEVVSAIFENPRDQKSREEHFSFCLGQEEGSDGSPEHWKATVNVGIGDDKTELVASGLHKSARFAMLEVMYTLGRSLGWV